jgi:hypothetical protein
LDYGYENEEETRTTGQVAIIQTTHDLLFL